MICPYCENEILGKAAAAHKLHCEKRPQKLKDITSKKLSMANSKRILTEETKQKISNRRKEYIKNNPDKVPYKLNHRYTPTYPELYFTNLLPQFIHNYRIPETLYEGDFVNPIIKLIIEIDGEQHYVDTKIVEHDIKRTAILEKLGWKIIRIRWTEFQKLDYRQKEIIIRQLNENRIEDNIDISELLPKYNCADCGETLKTKYSKRCVSCSKKQIGIINRRFNPSKEELQELVNIHSIEYIANMYGVSKKTIYKRCKLLNISRPTP